MGLYERLIGDESPRIPVHAFMSALGEVERGFMTPAQVTLAFNLTSGEQTEASTLLARILSPPEAYPIGGFVTLTNVGSSFDSTAASKGLGFVAVDTLGITRLECRIRYNKVGTGALSWQLWNDTDGQEIGTFTDSAAAGDNKVGSIVVTPVDPLGGGVRSVRLRVQSTTAADDPVYYGACIFVRRVAMVTSEALHEVLLLGEEHAAPYDSVAAIKTRLGV